MIKYEFVKGDFESIYIMDMLNNDINFLFNDDIYYIYDKIDGIAIKVNYDSFINNLDKLYKLIYDLHFILKCKIIFYSVNEFDLENLDIIKIIKILKEY